jgi:hypothetical protein
MQTLSLEAIKTIEKALWHLTEQEDNTTEEIRLINEIKIFLLSLED